MATTRYYYVGTLTSYSLTNITKENYPNPSYLSYAASQETYDGTHIVPFCYSTNLISIGPPVYNEVQGIIPSGYFLNAGAGLGGTFPGFDSFSTDLQQVTVPAGNYIYLPSYIVYRGDEGASYTHQYGSQDYWIIPSSSDSYSTINNKLTSILMGQDVDSFDVYANDQILVYYCATNVVFEGYLYSGGISVDSSTEGYINYVSGTLQLVKGDVTTQTTNKYTVKTSNSYDYSYGGYSAGSYSLEPSSVAITTTSLQAGKSATISVTRSSSTGSNASTYGFPITYKYQYSTNGGTSWTDIASSTATSYSFTIPSGVSSIMVQVIPSDSLGTGSAVTSSSYTVQQSKTYVGVSGVVRIASVKVCTGGAVRNANAYSCKDGVIKQT